MTFLKVDHVGKRFGGVVALNDVSIEVERGKVVGLIGPNGAGKTTLFNVVTGVFGPDTGQIHFKGESINGEKPYTICKKGIARTFQKCKPFLSVSVLQNVMTGALCRTGSMKRARDEAIEIIEFLGLRPKMDYPLSDVTLAEQRFVELAKALATKPEMLFLDEVMAGLTPEEIRRIIIKIKEVNQRGTTIVLVEHVMSAVMNLSEKLYVLNEGKLIAEGTPAEIARNGEVIKAYLGVEYHA